MLEDLHDDLPWNPARPQNITERTPREVHREKCPRCNGTGMTRYHWREGGRCFACEGRGFKEFKTTSEHRAKQREAARARKAKREQDRLAAAQADAERWIEDNMELARWIDAAADRGFDFAKSLREALYKWGGLTEKQEAAARRCAERDKDRDAERAKQAERAVSADVSRIEDSFKHARAAGLKFPKLRLAAEVDGDVQKFVFKRAADSGRNAGALYVTRDDVYLGKIMEGVYHPTREANDVTVQAVQKVASEPDAAAKVYGLRTGVCGCCGRELTKGESIERGIGPICAAKYGW